MLLRLTTNLSLLQQGAIDFAINLLGVCGFSTVLVCIFVKNIFSCQQTRQVGLPCCKHPGGEAGYQGEKILQGLQVFQALLTPVKTDAFRSNHCGTRSDLQRPILQRKSTLPLKRASVRLYDILIQSIFTPTQLPFVVMNPINRFRGNVGEVFLRNWDWSLLCSDECRIFDTKQQRYILFAINYSYKSGVCICEFLVALASPDLHLIKIE